MVILRAKFEKKPRIIIINNPIFRSPLNEKLSGKLELAFGKLS